MPPHTIAAPKKNRAAVGNSLVPKGSDQRALQKCNFQYYSINPLQRSAFNSRLKIFPDRPSSTSTHSYPRCINSFINCSNIYKSPEIPPIQQCF
ncbi:hypothetical protein AVEN_129524-1 [Araneus ventricosus]|uniref:Uncharacterized protein n=1 Tax=Araneus ventricosus TaxID=182803 RepID=A0A4Y2GIU2_ARAVE|nr:hypothetical protein AVEN_129524-1 [Araneus ventricosus]